MPSFSDRILAIDTATTACSVALFEDGQLVDSGFAEIGRGHAEKLVPMIAGLPDKGAAGQILVNCGPGSFTGVRIGLSAAKALALVWNADILGYQCLHLIAAQALAKMADPAPVYVAMTAGHGEYFVQNFDKKGIARDALQSLRPEAARQNCMADHLAGTAAADLADSISHASSRALLPDAAQSMLLFAHRPFIDASPVYGRPPDAQPSQQG